jgi:hypothetical protein
MRKFAFLVFTLLLTTGISIATPKGKERTFTGEISDEMCGLKHMMAGGAKQCTLECVDGGSKFILADPEHQKVYGLSDQKKLRQFAGEKVKVTGTLKGSTIEVSLIEAAP